MITVGSYATKNSWQSLAGFQSDPATIDQISAFSSKGPRRLCSRCNIVQKPEIAAPGQLIASSLSSRSSETPDRTDLDGVHLLIEGTSMAAPHVAGAVALILQAAPALTSDEVKTLLTSHTKPSDGFTGPLPNNIWGFGKLDVKAAFDATPNPPPAAPANLSVAAGDGTVALTWAANSELDIDGYQIYRSTTSGSGFIKLNSSLIRPTAFNDAGLTNGTTHFYRISAVDTKGQEGQQSIEASGTPASGGGAPALTNGGTSSGSGGGGCSIALDADFDPMLVSMIGAASICLLLRRIKKRHGWKGFVK